MADLVNEDADHVTFGAFQGPEATSKVEEHVVLLTFHAHAKENAATSVEIHPEVMDQEIAKAARVQADIRSANGVMFADQCTVSYADHEPEWFFDGKVEGLIP